MATTEKDRPEMVEMFDEKGSPASPSASGTASASDDVAKERRAFTLDYDPKEIQMIVREAILLGGGGAAILLQVANPGVGAGVNEHSNFAYRVTDRLRTTMTYVYGITFGTPKERAAIIDMVHRAHSTVKGRNYSADDPELQLWVAATLYAAGTDIYEKTMGPVPAGKAEKIYEEYSVLATALRVPPGMWPADRAAFWEYWDEKINSFEITDDAKAVARDLMWPKHAPLWIKVNMPAVRVLTTEWLPPRLREEYGLTTHRRTYKMLMALTRGVYPFLPMKLREFPVNFYLKDMRKRLKKAGAV